MTSFMSPQASSFIRLLLVDDHFVVRSGIAASLELEDDVRVVAEAADAGEALVQYEKHRPDAVIMDLQVAGSSGIDAIAQLCKVHPAARILVFSSFARDDEVSRALRAGALGYLQKAAPRGDLLQALRTVASGGRFLPADIAQRLTERLGKPEASARELEVLRLVAKGLGNKEIAKVPGVSDETIKTHVSHVMQKLKVNDRAHAVTEALRLGLIELERSIEAGGSMTGQPKAAGDEPGGIWPRWPCALRHRTPPHRACCPAS